MALPANLLPVHYSAMLWIFTVVSAAAGDKLCPYGWDDDPPDDRSLKYWGFNPPQPSYKLCKWGCCNEYRQPCCDMPVGLIVGGVVGGLLLLTLLFLVVCCCCWCHRKNNPTAAQAGRVISYPGATNVSMSTVSTTDSTPPHLLHTPSAPLCTSLPPGVYQPPPSYEEVIQQYGGHVNPAFKHESQSESPQPLN